MFEEKTLSLLKRSELQNLAKRHGIKANKKNAVIINELLNLKKENNASIVELPCKEKSNEDKNESCLKTTAKHGTPKLATPKIAAMLGTPKLATPKFTNISIRAKASGSKILAKDTPAAKIKSKTATGKDGQEKQEIPAKTQIPKLKNSARKNIDWESIHKNCFGKMESIDEYIQKKKQRQDQLKSLKSAAKDAETALSQIKKTHNTPGGVRSAKRDTPKMTKKMAKKSNTPIRAKENVGSSNTVNRTPLDASAKRPFHTQSSLSKRKKTFSFSKRASSIIKTKDRTDGKKVQLNQTFNSSSVGSSNIALGRKSCFGLSTPSWKHSGNLNATNPLSAKKFDLKESLKKPLSYKPHTGKLKTLEDQYAKKEEEIEKRRVNVKTMRKTQTRDDRRAAANQGRRNKKDMAVCKRRGIIA